MALIDDEIFTAVGKPGEVSVPILDPNKAYTVGAPSISTSFAGSQGYTAQTADYTTADTTTATSRGYEAAQGTAERAEAVTREVKPEETVQHLLAKILDENSPLLQRARSKALETMNTRGLLNSSMAVGAAQAALYDVARPIAEFDANVYGQAARDNQNFLNQIAMFNASEANRMTMFNVDSVNKARAFEADAANRVAMFNAEQMNAQARFNADAYNRAQMFNAQEVNAASRFTAEQANLAARFNAEQANINARAQADLTFRADLANADARNSILKQNLDNAFKAAISASDSATRIEMQKLQTASQIEVAQIEARYKAELQASAAAATLMQQAMTSAANIAQNPDMPNAAKNAAIQQQLDMAKTGMRVSSAITTLNINELFDYESLYPTSGGAPSSSRVEGNVIPYGGTVPTTKPDGTPISQSTASAAKALADQYRWPYDPTRGVYYNPGSPGMIIDPATGKQTYDPRYDSNLQEAAGW